VVTTLIPSTVPCDAGGTSPIFDINPLTGGRLGGSAFDLDADNNFSSGDYVTYGGVSIAVSGIYSTIGIVPQPTIIEAQPGKEIKVLSGSSGGLMTIMEKGGGGPPPGSRVGRRISWRELLSN
jgi:type IV pilus assembly protein PilY1